MQSCAGLGGCGGRVEQPGSTGHQPATACRGRRGMAGQEHQPGGEGHGAGRHQCRKPPMPRQRAEPPRARSGPVTRHLASVPAHSPHRPPSAIKPGGVTVATRRRGEAANHNITGAPSAAAPRSLKSSATPRRFHDQPSPRDRSRVDLHPLSRGSPHRYTAALPAGTPDSG